MEKDEQIGCWHIHVSCFSSPRHRCYKIEKVQYENCDYVRLSWPVGEFIKSNQAGKQSELRSTTVCRGSNFSAGHCGFTAIFWIGKSLFGAITKASEVGMTRMFDQSENMELCGDIYEGDLDGNEDIYESLPSCCRTGSSVWSIWLGNSWPYPRVSWRKKWGGYYLILERFKGYRTGSSTFMIFDTETQVVKKSSWRRFLVIKLKFCNSTTGKARIAIHCWISK